MKTSTAGVKPDPNERLRADQEAVIVLGDWSRYHPIGVSDK